MVARVLIATHGGGGLARAVEAGGSWQVETVLADKDVRALAVHPLNREVVYAGTQGTGLWRSMDAGRTWAACGLEGQVVKCIALSPAAPDTIYVGTKPPYVFVSKDGGASWTELEGFRKIRGRWLWFSPAESPYIAGYVQGLTVSPSDPDVIAAGIEFGAVIRSTDGGRTWSNHLGGALRDCHSLTFHASQSDWVYEGGGTGAGAAFSRDGGRTWSQPREGLDRHYGWAVAADPGDPEVWYVSLAPGPMKAHGRDSSEAYIFRMAASGTWEKLAGGLPQPLDHMPYALLTDSEAPGQLYAGLSNGDVWHTTDQGTSWQQLPVNLGHIERSMVLL